MLLDFWAGWYWLVSWVSLLSWMWRYDMWCYCYAWILHVFDVLLHANLIHVVLLVGCSVGQSVDWLVSLYPYRQWYSTTNATALIMDDNDFLSPIIMNSSDKSRHSRLTIAVSLLLAIQSRTWSLSPLTMFGIESTSTVQVIYYQQHCLLLICPR